MDHLLVRVGGRQVLVVDVCSSADGHGVGYGILLKRIDKVLWFARAMNVAVFYIREARAINTAVFRLESPDIEFVSRWSWTALWLRCVWAVKAPFRLGSPRLWMQRTMARVVLDTIYKTVERSPRAPRAIRRFVIQPRPLYQRLRRANAEHAQRSADAWRRAFKPEVDRRLRRAERQGRPLSRRLTLPADGERNALARAARLGLSPTAKLVTVHVREAGYRSAAGLRQRGWDTLRNAQIGSYREAFAALVDRGYTVVRLGDRTMSPITQEGVIDLAVSPEASEWLEAWCILRSAFLIGSDSGPSWLAFLLGVPVLTVNAVHFRDIARPADRMIVKLARERASGRLLSIAEMLTPAYLRTGLDLETHEHLDNTPADIRDAALDMLDVVDGNRDLTPAQRRFNEQLVRLGEELAHDWSGLEGISFVRRPRGALARPFAEKYWSAGQGSPSVRDTQAG